MEIDYALIGRWLAALGVPATIGWWIRWYIKDRRKQRNSETREERLIPYEVRGVAATTFEQESIAFQKATERLIAIKDKTIQELTVESTGKSDKIERQRTRIEELESQVGLLTVQVRELQSRLQVLLEELQGMSAKLADARIENEAEEIEDRRLHPSTDS